MEFNQDKKDRHGRQTVLSCHSFLPYPKKYSLQTKLAEKWNKKIKEWIKINKKKYRQICNWIKLVRTAEDNPKQLAKLKSWLFTHNEFKFLQNHITYPFISDGFNSGGYEWCCENWGSKWDLSGVNLNEEHKYSLFYTFDTAWSPPIPIMYKISEMFPHLTFTLNYEESGYDFCGTFEVKNEQILEDNCDSYYKVLKKEKINNYISLEILQEGFSRKGIVVLVDNEPISQCVALLFTNPHKNPNQNLINSIDEAEQYLSDSIQDIDLSPILTIEQEFWGHASNLQVWCESNYNTSILHRTIAFTLLRHLSEAGDVRAKRVFKEEIGRRFDEKYIPVQVYLIQEGYLDYLDSNELEAILFGADLEKISPLIIDNYFLKYNYTVGRFFTSLLKIARTFSHKYQMKILIKQSLWLFSYFNNKKLSKPLGRLQLSIFLYSLTSIIEEKIKLKLDTRIKDQFLDVINKFQAILIQIQF